MADLSTKSVYITSGLRSPAQFAALFHELGHLDDETTNPLLYRNSGLVEALARIGDVESMAMRLAMERSAWSFAFKALRPFVGRELERTPFVIDEIFAFAHSVGLQTYSDEVRDLLVE